MGFVQIALEAARGVESRGDAMTSARKATRMMRRHWRKQRVWKWWMWPGRSKCPGCRLVRGHDLGAEKNKPFARVKHEGGTFKGVRREN